MEKKEIHFTMDGDAGENNIIVNMNIEKAYSVNPNVKVVNNTFKIGTCEDSSASIKTQPMTEKSQDKKNKSLVEEIDIAPIRTEILNYVSRVRPLVAPDKKDKFMKMWKGILELDAVKNFVYETGKQKDTNFNRKLIANIIHHLDSRKMYAEPYKASDFAKLLEGNSEKSVRGELGKFPSDYMCAEINKYLETIGL